MTENTSPSYSTRDEFIDREIIAAIEASGVVPDARLEYDIEGIADRIIDVEMHGLDPVFFQRKNINFWDIVQAHEIHDGDLRILWDMADNDMSVATLQRWSSDDQDFIDIDSEFIETDEDPAPYQEAEEILKARYGLKDVKVVIPW